MSFLYEKLKQHLKKTTESSVNTAAQAQKYFIARQNELRLEEFLIPENLNSKEFRKDALERLDKLDDLLLEYKAFYSNYMVAVNKQSVGVVGEFSREGSDKAIESYASILENKLHEQSSFFMARKSWIDNMRALIRILDDNREVVYYDGDTFIFKDDDCFEEFNRCIKAIDEAADFEKVFLEYKKHGIMRSLARFRAFFK